MPQSEKIALLAVHLPDGTAAVEQWVHLLGHGRNETRDGRVFHVADAAALIERSYTRSTEIAVDYEHQTDLSEKNGQPAPAAGWIKKMEVRPSGIWGLVEWTQKARQMLREREYRFISPTIHASQATKVVNAIVGAGLTNRPALVSTALAKENSAMDLERIAQALNLAKDATVDDILEAIKTAMEKAVDLKDFVPAEQMRSLISEVSKDKQKEQEFRVTLIVNQAVASGKITPALRGWALAYCSKDPSGFDQMVAKMPVLLAPGEDKALARSQHDFTASTATPNDEAVARLLGIDAKAMT